MRSLTLLLCLALLAPVARADEPAAPESSPERLHFAGGEPQIGWAHLLTTGLYLGGLLGVWAMGSPESPRWTRVNGFDGPIADRLGRPQRSRREAIAHTSDALVVLLMAYPIVVEDLSLVLGRHRDPKLAARLIAIDAQAYALAGLIGGITKVASARQRPYAYNLGCEADPHKPGCNEDRNMSFMSGHAALSFTGAGLACFHQQQLEGLYPNLAATMSVCASGLALATLTSSFRVMADKHWTSDVLVGAGVGLFAGWLLPYLSHGRPVLSVQGDRAHASFGPLVDDRGGVGLAATGGF